MGAREDIGEWPTIGSYSSLRLLTWVPITVNEPEPIYQTERLLVRHITDGDVDAMYAVYGDAKAMQWVDDGRPIDREGCLRWIEVTKENYATRGYGMSALVLKEAGSVVGFCGIVHPGDQPEPEIKYALLRAFWGRGLATEAVDGMLAYAVEHLGLRRIIATTAPEHVASHRVLLKVGMSHLDTVRENDGSYTKTFAWSAENSGA
jgi:ribosomal-protein-alanine N-acetyltransferase